MRRTKSLLYMIIVLVPAMIFAAKENGVNFTWSEFDERWDCVVGIAHGNKPIGTGVFITRQSVITSANVIENYKDRLKEIKVYVINGAFNASSGRTVEKLIGPFGQNRHRKNSIYWVKHGFNYENSPVHDIYTLYLNPNQEDHLKTPIKIGDQTQFPIALMNKGEYKEGRYPFLAKLPLGNFFSTDKHYMFAGFGFVDREHIQNNTFLEIELYGEEEVVVDCDEWIPRQWGYFICILNVGHTAGVPSGAPLFNKGVLVGIGSFTLMKNNKSIHVFTDLREYAHKMTILVFKNESVDTYSDLFRWYEFQKLKLVKNLNYK